MIISLEGIDGCGKSTMCEFLQDYIRGVHDLDSVIVSEFNCTDLGKDAKKVLARIPSKTDQLTMVMSVRGLAAGTFLFPALQAGKVIIFDRYIHSTLAYQGGGDIGLDKIIERHCLACFGLPDFSILLKVPAETAVARITKRGDDARPGEYYAEIADRFIDAQSAMLDRCAHAEVSADRPEGEVKKRVADRFDRFYAKWCETHG